MPLGNGLRFFFWKFMNEVGEKKLAESYLFRRLAQLTIYQWTRLSEMAVKREISSSTPRFAKNFLRNLQEELKKIQGPKS